MTTIAAAPFTLAAASLMIGTDNYESAVDSVHFDPSFDTLTWRGLTPSAVYTDNTNPTWTCTFSFPQDWETANSLSQYLLTNQGLQKVVKFYPKGATTGKPLFTATVIIQPGPIGGDGNVILGASVTLGVVGAPALSTAP